MVSCRTLPPATLLHREANLLDDRLPQLLFAANEIAELL
jgi:hypothetical protein